LRKTRNIFELDELESLRSSPTEPLHDLKGHIANVIDETLEIGSHGVKKAVREIKNTFLNKETVRCSDLRKAAIVIYLKLKNLTDLLRLHNQAFLHAYYCTVLFSQPKSVTRRRMFGR
jgi:hypothetical protein